MGRRKQGYVTKQSKEFIEYILQNVTLDEEQGIFSSKVYCSTYVNFGFKGNTLSVPISHLIWLLKHGKWPKDGMHIDHIDENPLNNRPNNLKELTHKENAYKKRGKGNSYYGSTKYGYGIRIDQDKRDERYYVSRYLSSKEELNKNKRKKSLGGFSTLEEAEQYVKEYVESMNDPTANLPFE